MAPYFVVVEDDHLQEGPLQDHLAAAFPDAAVETLCSEREFRERLPALRSRPPDVVVMDVMLRWTLPASDAPPPPPDVAADGYYRAGLRCARILLADARLARVPVILYTILERGDLERDGRTLPSSCTYVGKNTDLDVLSRMIRALCRAQTGPVRQRGTTPAQRG